MLSPHPKNLEVLTLEKCETQSPTIMTISNIQLQKNETEQGDFAYPLGSSPTTSLAND